MTDIDLQYHVPPSDLEGAISLFYQFTSDRAEFVDPSYRADFPQLMFVLRGREGFIQYDDRPRQMMSQVFLIGPSSINGTIGGKGPMCAFGMGITTAGWMRLLPPSAPPFNNLLVDAVPWLGEQVLADHAALAAASCLAERTAYAEAMMRRLLAPPDPETDHFVAQIDGWLAASLSPELAELESITAMSPSQIARRCKRIYGVPPKLLARKFRALRAAAMIANGQRDPLDFVAEGFYDQAHMIREIKHFTGLTPTALRDRPTELTRLTIGRSRLRSQNVLIT